MVNKLIKTSQKILGRQSSSILSAAVVITGSNLLSALLGLLRTRLLTSRFFATSALASQLDAFWVAFRLPDTLFQILVIGALSAAFIPVYSGYKKKDQQSADELAVSLMNIILIFFALISVFIIIFAKPFTHIITANQSFTLEQVNLAASLSRIMIIAQLFFAASNFITGILQAHQRFLLPALSPVAYNLGIILAVIFLTPTLGIYAPAIGVIIGAIMHLLLQLPLAYRLGFRYSFKINKKHPGLKGMARLVPPRFMAISANQIEQFASTYFATALPIGSLTIISISQQLLNAPIRITSIPIGQASLPFMSDEVATGEMTKLRRTIISSLHQILFMALPASSLLLVLRIPLVRLAFGGANFPWQATLLTGKTVAILSLSLFAAGGLHVVNRAFYALHNTVTPFITAMISVIGYIVGSYLAVYVFHTNILGLAVVMTLSNLFHFVLLFGLLVKAVGGFDLKTICIPPLKMTLSASIMAICLWIPLRLLDQFVFDTTRVVPLVLLTLIASSIGAIVYISLAKLLGIDELAIMLRLGKKIKNWRQIISHTETEEVLDTTSATQELNPL